MTDSIEPVSSISSSSSPLKQWLGTDENVNAFLKNEMSQFNVNFQQTNASIARQKEYFKSAIDDPEAPST